MAEIYSIVYQPQRPRQKPNPSQYMRVPTSSVNLIQNYGIEGDRKAGNPKRQLNIMTYETLEAMREEGYKTNPGEMGEQIIIKGLDVMALAPGARIQIGERAVVEIIKPREGCDWFEEIQGKSPKEALNRLGMLAKVVRPGRITVGDAVTVVEFEQV